MSTKRKPVIESVVLNGCHVRKGHRVEHVLFGKGKIVRVNAAFIAVDFDKHGVKELQLCFAGPKLTVVNPSPPTLSDHRQQMGAVLADLEDAKTSAEMLLQDVRRDGITGTRIHQYLVAIERLLERGYKIDSDMAEQ